MFENDRKETASKAVTSVQHRNGIEKSTWKTHRYFVDFESRIHVEISTSNRRRNFHVDLPFRIDKISTNFSHGISKSNRWQTDEYMSTGLTIRKKIQTRFCFIFYLLMIYQHIFHLFVFYNNILLFQLIFHFHQI